jgi:hypothetical protein
VPRRARRTPAVPETFLPRSIARAADDAAEQVLKEDELLHKFGIAPANGRSR